MTTIPVGFMNKKASTHYNVFYIGGRNNIDDNYAYAINNNSWSSALASIPIGVGASAFTRIGNEIILVGGENTVVATTSTDSIDNVQIYNMDTDTWRDSSTDVTVVDYPFPVTQTICVNINGEAYVLGGLNGNTVNSSEEVYKRNNSTGAWISYDDCPVGLRQNPAAVINNKVYVFGGQEDRNGVYEFDPSQSSGSQWSQLTDMTINMFRHCGAAIGNLVYLFGWGLSGDVYVYDVSNPSNQNGVVPAYECDISSGIITLHSRAISYNDNIYILRVYDKATQLLRFDPNATTKWVDLGLAPYNTFGLPCFVLDDRT